MAAARPYLNALAAFSLFLLLPGPLASLAQGDVGYLEVVRALDTNDLGLLNPTGLAFSPDANLFFVLEADSTAQANIVTMTPLEEFVGSFSIDVAMIDPINMAYDYHAGRLLLFDTGSNELIEIKAAADGYLDPSSEGSTRYQVGQLGLQEPRGLAVDPANGHLLILDSSAPQLVRIEPDSEGGFDAAAALIEGRVSLVDLKQVGLVDPRGLAVNPNNRHLYLLSLDAQRAYELTQAGQLVAALDLPPFEFVDPQGLVFAFSGDTTDDPSTIHLYIADTGLSEGNKTGQELGRIVELSLPIVNVPGDAPTIQAAVELASEGDLVLVAPGTYQENVQLSGETVVLASHVHIWPQMVSLCQTVRRLTPAQHLLPGTRKR